MCGICGIYRPVSLREGDGRILDGMIRSLRHRGPDGAGVWSDEHVAFGHTRLAIIDLEGGAQPMVHRPSGAALVFNGEIYNYRELRRELEAVGERFITASDTEVLLKGLLRHRERFLDRLEGMFAFAFWQPATRELLLARDRYGEKPLYLHHATDGTIAFASEIKCLMQPGLVPPRLRADVVPEFFLYRDVLGPETLIDKVEELPPASYQRVVDGQRGLQRYWKIEDTFAGAVADAPDEIERRTEALLVQAVGRRLVSDVPVGAITSGGLDSSLVSALAQRASTAPLHTFCVGFRERDVDESADAARMASHIGSIHHGVMVGEEDVERHFDTLTWVHDLPLTHPNAIPMHLVFRYAREEAGVTVVLSGEGADEVFGGYDWYRTMLRRERLRAWQPLIGLATLFAPERQRQLVRRVMSADYPLLANAVLPPTALEGLGCRPERALAKRRQSLGFAGASVSEVFHRDQRTYLPGLLRRQDRMAMAAGVEARVVFLDRDLVSYVNAVRVEFKLARGRSKAILRTIGDRWLPRETLAKKKVGFTLPLLRWFGGTGPLGARLRALDDPASGLRRGELGVDPEYLGHTVAGLSPDLMWSLLALDTWHDLFIRCGRTAPASSGAQRARWHVPNGAHVLER